MTRDAFYIGHMLECIADIKQYTAAGHDEFSTSKLVQDAVIRKFEIIGEAAKRVSAETTARFPDVPCRRIAGFRDFPIHQYLSVDTEEVWNIVALDLPDLERNLRTIELGVGGD